jgi:hypothetical protein
MAIMKSEQSTLSAEANNWLYRLIDICLALGFEKKERKSQHRFRAAGR